MSYPSKHLFLVFMLLSSIYLPSLATARPLKNWTLTESLGHQWTNELIFYPLAANFPAKPGQEKDFTVTDETTKPLPFQFWIRTDANGKPEKCLALLVDLAPYAKRTFTLTRAKNPAVNPKDLAITEDKGSYLLSTSRTAARIAGRDTVKPGTPFAQLPPPILAVKGVSGVWLGEGSLSGMQPVTKYSSQIEAAGPLFLQAKIRYEFGPRKFYQVRVRLVSGENMVLVNEDFALSPEEVTGISFIKPPDLAPEIGTPSHYNDWLINKGIGWNDIPTDVSKYPCFRFNFTKGWGAERARGIGVGQAKPVYTRKDLAHAQQDWRLGFVLTPFQERGFRQSTLGFDAEGGEDYLGVFHRFGSHWVHPNENRVLMPWLEEGVVGHFLAFEGHREWGMMVSATGPQNEAKLTQGEDRKFALIQHAQVKYGDTPLDKVKDWVLEWDLPKDAFFPRIFYTPDSIARMKRDYPQLPEDIKKLIKQDIEANAFLTGDTNTLRQSYLNYGQGGLRDAALDFLNGGNNTHNTYTHRYGLVVISYGRKLDIALSASTVTNEERKKALAIMAFHAYKMADQDYWAYHGYAGGPSNPNMMTSNCNALATAVAMLPGHPMQREWLQLLRRMVCADVFTSISPAGAWLESPGYQGAGNTPLNETVLILKNTGTVDLTSDPVYGKRLNDVSTYFANLLTPPDPRFQGRRMPMALGDNTPFWNNHYTYLADSAKDKFPTQAGNAIWCWQQMGRPIGEVGLMLLQEHVLDDTVKPLPITGKSLAFPGFGAFLRHGFGTKYETFCTFRQSDFAYGHFDEDQGSFSFFAKGAPLCLDWIDYSPQQAEYHNRVVYSDQAPPWLVPTPDVVTTHDEADYVRSHEGERADKTPAWSRQLVMVKDTADPGDATYFVLRDLVHTDKPSTWNVWTLAKKGSEKIDGNIARLEGQYDVDLSIFFTRKPAKPLTATFHHHRTTSYITMDQDQTRIQATADSGGDYSVVLYPLRRGIDKEPEVRELASGVIEVKWTPDRRHLLFLFPEVTEVKESGITFKGRAAIAKIERGKTLLIPLECETLSNQ
ncbi:MAG: hypothetical protein ACYDBB_26810 [Armatimonadota bacterium]